MNILLERFRTQHLVGPGLARPEHVVALLCAVQSQDYAGASWSLGQRLKSGTQTLVNDAIATGTIVRTHVLRPTWHFVVARDLRWMLSLTAPHVKALCVYQLKKLELDAKTLARARKVIERALAGSVQLTRNDLGLVVARAGMVMDGGRLAQVMMMLELDAVVCSGAMRGKQQSYALVDEWVRPTRPLQRDEALAELAQRFFSGHSPATIKHFAWWSGLKISDAKRAVSIVHDDVEVLHDDWLGISRATSERIPSAAHFIPEYDEALVGWRDMTATANNAMPRTSAFVRPIIIGGRSVGAWRRTLTSRECTIQVHLAVSLAAAQRKALQAAAARYADFIGLPTTITEVS